MTKYSMVFSFDSENRSMKSIELFFADLFSLNKPFFKPNFQIAELSGPSDEHLASIFYDGKSKLLLKV